MTHHTRRALHFGAGNIGRGFIGPLLVKSGFRVTFVDVNHEIINLLHAANHYSVEILCEDRKTDIIRGVDGICPDAVVEILADRQVEIVTTSVGAGVLGKIAGCIGDGLVRRMKNGGAGSMNIVACENMVGGSQALKKQVEDYLMKTYCSDEEELGNMLRWVEEQIGWPNCAVDRIVPPFETPQGASQLDVGVEPFFEWTIDATQIKGNSLHVDGAKFVENLEAYLERKLYTLNCAHASLAYLGFIKGYTTLTETMNDPSIRTTVQNILHETGSALIRRHNFNPASHSTYIDTILSRFTNPTLKDELTRIGRQPIRKLGPKERLVAPVNMLRGFGMERSNLLTAIAAALCYDVCDDEESVEIQRRIRGVGVESTLRELTGWSKGDTLIEKDVQFVLERYGEFACY